MFLLENAPAFAAHAKEVEAAEKAAAAKAVDEREMFAKAVEQKKVAERSCHTAASKGDLAALSRLVEQGTIDFDAPDDGGYTPLLKAAANNHLSCVDFLLAKVRL